MSKLPDFKELADRLDRYNDKKMSADEVRQLADDLRAVMHSGRAGGELAEAIRRVLADLTKGCKPGGHHWLEGGADDSSRAALLTKHLQLYPKCAKIASLCSMT
jgi:hypothetical protein